MKYKLWFAAIIILFISCAQNKEWATRINWKEYQFSNLPGEKEFPDYDAIVLLDEGKMETSGKAETPLTIFSRHRMTKILTTRGYRYANIAIQYSPGTRVEYIRARTISPDGKITVLDHKKIYDVNLYPDFVFYSDQRAKIFTMPAVEKGSIIEYRYELYIPQVTFGHSWQFQEDVPTLISRFTLLEPLGKSADVNYKLYGIEIEPEIVKNPEGFKSTYFWEARDIPALKIEQGMPPLSECTAQLAISPLGIKNWDDVSDWYYEISESRIKANQELIEFTKSLVDSIDDDLTKLKTIYEWVRDQVRYISVSIGIGGFQPHYASDVFVNKYGDCKDMTTLLCSMARAIGIDAYQALISTHQNGVPDTSMASPYHFNHVIAYCPDVGDSAGVWMDATEKGCPFGLLPWYDRGLPTLVVGKYDGAGIKYSPKTASSLNKTLIDWDVKLQTDGSAIIHGTTELSGDLSSDIREELFYASKDTRKRWLETYLAQKCSGAKLDTFSITGLFPVNDPLIISYQFQTKTFATKRTNQLSFRPGQIASFTLPDYFRSKERFHPLQFKYGSILKLKLNIQLPDSIVAKPPFLTNSLISDFGNANWEYSNSGNIFSSSFQYYIDGGNIEPNKYAEFQSFLDGIRYRDLMEVVIERKNYNNNK